MRRIGLFLVCSSLFVVNISTRELKSVDRREHSKFLPIFQVVTFPNDPCVSNNVGRNGTCFAAAECESNGGTASGTCASGYGVCCVFTLACGQTTSQNCTYLVQAASSAIAATPCTYTICPCNTNICRIRLDFQTFNIAGPATGTVSDAAATISTNGGSIGDCIDDSFTLTAPGNSGSPVICGFNTGQHMIVDANSGTCNLATFNVGASSNTREWDIKVTQYTCGDDNAGPDGCLQYFTGTSGRISSFNFPTTGTSVAASTTHLSDQCYTMCFRQELGRCAICYTTAITNTVGAANTPDDDNAQTSFGLSASDMMAMARSMVDGACGMDFLLIPNAENAPITVGTIPVGQERICGRVFSAIAMSEITGVSVCSQSRPFRITFKTNANEMTAINTAAMADMNEQSVAPGGIIGFSLNYMQIAC